MNRLGVKERSRILDMHRLIQDRDLSLVRNYLEVNDKLTPDQTRAIEVEYKRFIALSFAVKEGRNIPISNLVDPFWHTHIMFTHDYTAMCVVLGGEYIHHVPAVTPEERERLCSAYHENTLPLYEEVFGKPNPDLWPVNGDICIACCDRDHHPNPKKRISLVV